MDSPQNVIRFHCMNASFHPSPTASTTLTAQQSPDPFSASCSYHVDERTFRLVTSMEYKRMRGWQVKCYHVRWFWQ